MSEYGNYYPPAFHVTDRDVLVQLMRAQTLATIVSHGPAGLVTSQVPVLVRMTGGQPTIAGHVARANDHWRLMDGATEALLVFAGPHGYVSPTWYGSGPAVPTWNYAVVHARGRPVSNDDARFARGVLAELATAHEQPPPAGWHPDQLPAELYDQMLGAIVAFSMPVEQLDGKLKLGQNRSVADRRRTIAALDQLATPQAILLAQLMRDHAEG